MPRKPKFKSCSFQNCDNKSNDLNRNIKFFGFPSNEELCKLWIKECHKEKLNTLKKSTLTSSYYVCEDHFDRTDYQRILTPQKKFLSRSAIPKILLSENPTTSNKDYDKSSDNLSIPAQSPLNDPGPSHQQVLNVNNQRAYSDSKLLDKKLHSDNNQIKVSLLYLLIIIILFKILFIKIPSGNKSLTDSYYLLE